MLSGRQSPHDARRYRVLARPAMGWPGRCCRFDHLRVGDDRDDYPELRTPRPFTVPAASYRACHRGLHWLEHGASARRPKRSIGTADTSGELAAGAAIQALSDRIGVVAWSAFHPRDIAAATGKDAVVMLWAEWGWVGGSTSTYVISDAHDESGTVAGAEKWRKRMKLDCAIEHSEWIWPALYLAETSDCQFRLARPIKHGDSARSSASAADA